MRFLVMVKGTPESPFEHGVMPTDEQFAIMGAFNQEMINAGVMLEAAGLEPTSKGKRIKFSGGKTRIVDGPFTESKELVAGFWIIEAKSQDEAVAWIRRAPFDKFEGDSEVEIRKVMGPEDFQ
jgi:hypothetical protein